VAAACIVDNVTCGRYEELFAQIDFILERVILSTSTIDFMLVLHKTCCLQNEGRIIMEPFLLSSCLVFVHDR